MSAEHARRGDEGRELFLEVVALPHLESHSDGGRLDFISACLCMNAAPVDTVRRGVALGGDWSESEWKTALLTLARLNRLPFLLVRLSEPLSMMTPSAMELTVPER